MNYESSVNRRGAGPQFFKKESGLIAVGLLGLLLGVLCQIWIWCYGAVIPPEGNLHHAVSFNLAFGIFILTTAAIFPFAGFRFKTRRTLRRIYIGLALLQFWFENSQNFRGINPRFTDSGQIYDILSGALFGVMALLGAIWYIPVIVRFFRSPPSHDRQLIILGIRYGLITTLFAFAAGIWIVIEQGRYTGLSGNIMVLHGLGFHGLQAIPFIAWFMERTSLPVKTARRVVHLGGIAWIAGISLIGIQTLLGRTVFEWTAIPVICGIFLGCWLVACAYSFLHLLKQRSSLKQGETATPS